MSNFPRVTVKKGECFHVVKQDLTNNNTASLLLFEDEVQVQNCSAVYQKSWTAMEVYTFSKC